MHDNGIADRKLVVHVRPQGLDVPGYLMAQCERRAEGEGALRRLYEVHVGMAHSSRVHVHQDLPSYRDWLGHVRQHRRFSQRGQPEGFHGSFIHLDISIDKGLRV